MSFNLSVGQRRGPHQNPGSVCVEFFNLTLLIKRNCNSFFLTSSVSMGPNGFGLRDKGVKSTGSKTVLFTPYILVTSTSRTQLI